MPRINLIRTNEFPYHITCRSNLKIWYSIPMQEVWEIAMVSFSQALSKYPANIHAFVLMNNHYHLVIDTPHSNIDKFMYEFNKMFSKKLRQRTNLVNKMFGSRYRWSLIYENIHYLHVLKYVFRNPVKANISNLVEEYPYSSLYLKNYLNYLPFTLSPYINTHRFLTWFNVAHTEEQNNSLKKGLQKTSFNYSGSRHIRKSPEFDVPLCCK